MLTYLTEKGLSDAQIQLISGRQSKKSLENLISISYSMLSKAITI